MNHETEAGFQAALLELAAVNGWHTYHTFDSRRSNSGWPDLVLVRPPRALFVELKRNGAKPTDAQATWLDRLTACGLHATVWRPADWPTIEETLRSPRPGEVAYGRRAMSRTLERIRSLPEIEPPGDDLSDAVTVWFAKVGLDVVDPVTRATVLRLLDLLLRAGASNSQVPSLADLGASPTLLRAARVATLLCPPERTTT